MAFKMKGSPHKMGTIMGTSAFKQFTGSNKEDVVSKEEKEYATAGIPGIVYDVDGNKVSTDNMDHGNLTEWKTGEDGRKYFTVKEDTKRYEADTRFYLKSK